MTEDVARKLPPYVYRERTRHGRAVYYFRRARKGSRLRLPDYGSPAFDEAYRTALAGTPGPKGRLLRSGTLEWLIEQYRQSRIYGDLSRATRNQRDNIFLGVIKKSGVQPFVGVNEASIQKGIEDRSATPFQAHHFSVAMRGLFRWAKQANHITTDPTAGVSHPRRPRTGGFQEWTEDDVETFERRWPVGTKERVWLHVLLFTGVRRGDAVRLGKQHIRKGILTIATEKTGTEISIPVLADLAATIAAGPTGDLALVVGDNRTPLTKESFGNYFREACNEAGLTKSAHGLRKLAATRLADGGATDAMLDAWFGWLDGKTSKIYTRKADRKRLARAAAERMMVNGSK